MSVAASAIETLNRYAILTVIKILRRGEHEGLL